MLRQAFVALFSYAVAPLQYAVDLIQYVAERFRTWLRGPEPGQGDAENIPSAGGPSAADVWIASNAEPQQEAGIGESVANYTDSTLSEGPTIPRSTPSLTDANTISSDPSSVNRD